MISNTTPKYNSKFLRKKSLLDGDAQEIINILQRSAQNAQALVAADECSIAILEPDTSILIAYSTRQEPGEKLKRALLQQTKDIGPTQYQSMWALFDTKQPAFSSINLPLIENGVLVGMLRAQNFKTETFDSHKTEILSIFADQLTLMISKLLKANDEVQEATLAKTSFFSMITHELRSPLNAINGYLELAMSGVGGELNAQQYEFVQRARVGSERLYALLENMLLIARADNGQMQLNREIIRLQDVIENAVEELELTASDQHISIDVNSTGDSLKIYADAVRLQQVLRNLIDNALNFTCDGGKIAISMAIDTSKKNGNERQDDEEMGILKLQVSDTGIGIAPGYHTLIFERFFQVTNESIGRASGPGLGLAIVKMIVELHGGSILVESIPEHGSTFTCTLPCILP